MTTDEAGGDSMLDLVTSDLVELEERFEARIEALEELVDAQQDRIDDLERRTDLLQIVDDVEEMEAKQRSATILQHMQKKIQADDSLEKTFLTKDEVVDALHYPDQDRTTFYTDMQRCERLVGDDDICWYVKKSESKIDQAVVYLDLSAGDLPSDLNGGV